MHRELCQPGSPPAPAVHGRNSSETAVRQDALYLDMPMDVPMVHLVANIAKGWIWIEDRGWETERAALVVAMPPSAGSASAALEFVQPMVLRAAVRA